MDREMAGIGFPRVRLVTLVSPSTTTMYLALGRMLGEIQRLEDRPATAKGCRRQRAGVHTHTHTEQSTASAGASVLNTSLRRWSVRKRARWRLLTSSYACPAWVDLIRPHPPSAVAEDDAASLPRLFKTNPRPVAFIQCTVHVP